MWKRIVDYWKPWWNWLPIKWSVTEFGQFVWPPRLVWGELIWKHNCKFRLAYLSEKHTDSSKNFSSDHKQRECVRFQNHLPLAVPQKRYVTQFGRYVWSPRLVWGSCSQSITNSSGWLISVKSVLNQAKNWVVSTNSVSLWDLKYICHWRSPWSEMSPNSVNMCDPPGLFEGADLKAQLKF